MLYVTYTLNFLLMMALPFLLAAFLARRLGTRWGLIWVGAVTFIGSQVVHIPLNALLGRLGIIQPAKSGWPLVLYAVVLGLLAGLCEELARYLVLRFWLKRDRSWRSALMFGAGHGGAEAFILGLLAAVQTIALFVASNVDPARLGVTAAQLPLLQQQLAAFWGAPVLYSLLGAFERMSALATHLFLAVLVMQVFTRKNILWLFAAIFWHALTDATAVFAVTTWGAVPTEAAIAVLALIGLALIFALRQPEPPAVAPVSGPASPVTANAAPLPVAAPTAEQLDRTRYQ
jgi:uncharacterized membrane protein YhfC